MKPIIFLGMAGVGKTTIAKAVSVELNMHFIDTDDQIIHDKNIPLDELIKQIGDDAFINLEAEYVKKLLVKNCVFAPGGSFIYAKDVINSIKDDVVLIYLFDEQKNILNRIPNLKDRGIIGFTGNNFSEIYNERDLLYKEVAHVQFNINHFGFDKTTSNIIKFLKQLAV